MILLTANQATMDVIGGKGVIMVMDGSHACHCHLPDSQARCSRGRRPSLAESVLSSTYWGREDDLDIEYSLIFQPNANLMLAHCLRHWLNINSTLPHVTSRVW